MLNLRAVLSDERGFVHKRIFGGIKGAIGGLIGGGPLGIVGGAARGFLGGGAAGPQATSIATRFQAFAKGDPRLSPNQLNTPRGVVRLMSGQLVSGTVVSQLAAAGSPGSCPPGFIRTPFGCVNLPFKQPPGIGVQPLGPVGEFDGDAFGEARVGRFGAGLEPEQVTVDHRRCPRGAVLAVDGLCYNKRDLRNSDRAWPRGRRPLLTGGEMRAISTASAAAKKLQRKQKQLESLGLLKRPAPRSRRALPAGAAAAIPRVVQIQQE